MELDRNRCVGLFGPRQAGKSTIARQIGDRRGEGAVMLDMRNARDRKALADDDVFFETHADKLVVIDEAHRDPDAMDVVHRRIEREIHTRSGETRFLVLGSSSIDLQQLAAERLGARLTPVLIDPIQFFELPVQGRSLRRASAFVAVATADEEAIAPELDSDQMDALWLRGGFPPSFLAANDQASFAWRKAYLTACIRRPPGAAHAELNAGVIKATLDKIAASQCGVFPGEKSPAEFREGVRYLEGLGLLRVLLPWYPSRTNQLERRPKLIIRDSGLLHALRRCTTMDAVTSTAGLLGESWEGFVVEALIAAAGDRAQPFHYRWNNDQEIDLVLEFDPRRRWAIEIKHNQDPKPSKGFYVACDAIGAERRIFVHRGAAPLIIGNGIEAFPLRDAIDEVLKA
jgi:predicted AAA+ superfamily ATPase